MEEVNGEQLSVLSDRYLKLTEFLMCLGNVLGGISREKWKMYWGHYKSAHKKVKKAGLGNGRGQDVMWEQKCFR
jgi:hypothetical protein